MAQVANTGVINNNINLTGGMVAPNFTADNFKKKINQRVTQPRGQSLGGLKPMVGSNGAIIAQHGAQGGSYMV